MAGILGDLFGLGGGTQAPTPGLLDAAGYMDPAQYDRMRQSQSMMGLWAGLLAGGGPSLSPRNFGSALGAGLTGAQQFGAQFDEASQHRAAAQKNLADIVAKKQGFQIAQDWINKGGTSSGTPADGAAAPGAGSSTPNFGAESGGARATSSTTANADLPPEARAFLDTVAGPESGGAYNARWPGTTFSGYDDHPRIFAPGPEGPSSAAGRYQIVASTWDGLNKKYNFPDFKPETQDSAAWKLAEDTYRSRTGGDLSAALKEGKLQEVQQMLKGQWGTLNMANYGANLRKYGGGGTEGGATAGGALAQVPDYSGALGGQAPAPAPAPAILTAPGANPNVPPTPGAGAALGTGRTVLPPGRGLVTPQDYADWQASGRIPSGPVNVGPSAGVPGGPVNVRQLAGDAAPAEAGPSFGYGSAGGAISPAALAAAAGGAPPVPAALVAPAQPVPAPAPPVTQPPVVAAAPAPAVTQPQGAPGPMTVTLPAPPAPLALPAVPAAQPLPAAPEIPGVPARPQIPGATAGAAVSPAVAARARQAQGVVLGLSMMGVHVPDFLQKEAGIEVAGRTAAAEAEAKQPIELQNKAFEASLTAAQKRWDALDDQQKQTLAFQRGLTKDQMNAMYANIHEQYKSILGLTTARAMEEQKTAGGAENTQITMTIGNREVPMTVAQANRISRGESPEQVLGPGVLQLGKAANTGQIPEGYQMVPGADGGGPRMEPLPGSPQARALDQKQTSQQQNASVVTQDLRRAQDLVTGGYVTGLYGRGAQLLPGTDRTRFDALVGGIGANFSIDRLQQMRDASPTGGALGQVTEGEHKLLRDSYGSLSPEQGEKQLSENIGRVHQRYMDIVNGTPEQLGKMLREGRITKDRYDTLIAQRDLPAGGGAAATPGGAIRTPYGTIRPVQ